MAEDVGTTYVNEQTAKLKDALTKNGIFRNGFKAARTLVSEQHW